MLGSSRARAGIATGAVAVLAAGLAAAMTVGPGATRRSDAATTARVPPAEHGPARAAATVPPGPPPAYVATLRASVPYSASPGGPPSGRLAAKNPFGTPQVLAVVGVPNRSGWLHVELPIRPNGTTAWIPAKKVALTHTYFRIAVSLSARVLIVTDAGNPVLITPVAVGSPSSPTPQGETYLWELIRPNNPNGAYGPYIFGLAEFSDTYATFNGGNAQIGIHGQDQPSSIGKPASHGCVRLPNDVIVRLAGMLPLGTPVTIR